MRIIASQRAHLWIITTHNAIAPLNLDGEKKPQKNFFTSLPGLESGLAQKYFTKKQPTILRHLQQPRKGLLSTQEKVIQSEPEPEPHPEQEQFPPPTQSEDTNIVFLKAVDLTRKFYTDQTGRLPMWF